MSMTDEIKNIVAEKVEKDEAVTEEVSEVTEEVEEEVEVTEAEEELAEMDHSKKKKVNAKYHKEMDHGDAEDDDEDEQKEGAHDDDEEEEDEVEEMQMPKTKAAVINAAMDILKKAKKHEAQQLFAKMMKMSESEDVDGMVKKGENQTKKVSDPKTKPSDASSKMEEADWSEDLDAVSYTHLTLPTICSV